MIAPGHRAPPRPSRAARDEHAWVGSSDLAGALGRRPPCLIGAVSTHLDVSSGWLDRCKLMTLPKQARCTVDSMLRTVADAMTRKIVTVTEKDVLEKLEEGMERLRFRHLPVVDDEGKLVGLLTHSDIRHAWSTPLSDREQDRNAIIGQVPVGRVMQHEVVTVEPGDSLIEAGKLMWEAKIGCLPVVDEEGSLVGIVTAADFIRIALQLLGSDVPKVDVDELARLGRSMVA